MSKPAEPCEACVGKSDRPGFLIGARFYDRLVNSDVIGERKLTSGVEYVRCFVCRGTGRAVPDELKLEC